MIIFYEMCLDFSSRNAKRDSTLPGRAFRRYRRF